MEDDFAGKEGTQSTAAEVNKIYAWHKATPDDHVKQKCWQKSTKYTTGMEGIPHSMDTRPRPQGFRALFRGG